MSESASKAGQADPGPELDAIADELYAMPPDGFAAARDEQVKKARAEGQQPLARELARLRRPTQSAWLINLLWRDQREVMEQLLELAEELSRAQADASGPELQRLTAVRRGLEAGLIRGAKVLAQKAGVAVSASTEREAQETLAAALALPEVASEVRTGRLVKPASYAGFGTVVSTTPPSPARLRPVEKAEPAPTPGLETDEIALRKARRAREEAERQVQEARAAVEIAAATLAESGRVADTASEHQRSIAQQVEELENRLREVQDQLREAQNEIPAAVRAEAVATSRREQAETAHAAAVQTLADAERQLKALAAET